MNEVIDWLKGVGRYDLHGIIKIKMDLQKFILTKYDPGIMSPLEKAVHRAKSILSTKSYFQVLDVAETATCDEIVRNYRKLCLLLHPDKIGHDATCKNAFEKVGIAKEILSNPVTRKEHSLALPNMQSFDSIDNHTCDSIDVQKWVRDNLEDKKSLNFIAYRMAALDGGGGEGGGGDGGGGDDVDGDIESADSDDQMSQDLSSEDLSEAEGSDVETITDQGTESDSGDDPVDDPVDNPADDMPASMPVHMPMPVPVDVSEKMPKRLEKMSAEVRSQEMHDTLFKRNNARSKGKKCNGKRSGKRFNRNKKTKETSEKHLWIQSMHNLFVEHFKENKEAYDRYARVFYKMMENSHSCRNFQFKFDAAFADNVFHLIENLPHPDNYRALDRGFSYACLTSLGRIGKGRCTRAFSDIETAISGSEFRT